MKVVHLQRKPGLFHFSIEALFTQLRAALSIGKEVEVSAFECPYLSIGLRNRWRNIRAAGRIEAEVYHITGDVHYLALGLPGDKTILTIHDCAFLATPNRLKRFILWLFWLYLPVRCSRIVTVISEATRQDVRRHLPQGMAADIRVIPNCLTQNLQRSPQPFNTEEPHILLIGTKANKNQELHLAALAGIPCRISILGEPVPALQQLSEEHQLNISWHHQLSAIELQALYTASDLLLFASLSEGFGLPILEAQQVGRPVITSNCSSMPEVAGSAACYVDPQDTDSIRTGLLRVIRDVAYREGLIDAGFENVGRFSPDRVAEQYHQLYEELNADNK